MNTPVQLAPSTKKLDWNYKTNVLTAFLVTIVLPVIRLGTDCAPQDITVEIRLKLLMITHALLGRTRRNREHKVSFFSRFLIMKSYFVAISIG